jgi:hypothetical protein
MSISVTTTWIQMYCWCKCTGLWYAVRFQSHLKHTACEVILFCLLCNTASTSEIKWLRIRYDGRNWTMKGEECGRKWSWYIFGYNLGFGWRKTANNINQVSQSQKGFELGTARVQDEVLRLRRPTRIQLFITWDMQLTANSRSASQKFSELYGTRRFTTVFSDPCAEQMNPVHTTHSVLLWYILILSSHLLVCT